ncbi:hypothetical protein GOBAR_AA20254 [Gossypium barbadense]|uniref:Uncharacterized protein n=1 Tax=Gossypium barbadense TaxID=3634 RepID=A0A2P5XAN6_GOSBA|nr:hypothetical protein GOBAR_AA20254 [Gossypium barbadense]
MNVGWCVTSLLLMRQPRGSVNFQKYGVLFGSNIIMADRSMVHLVLRVMALPDHGRLSLIGRNKKQIFGFILDRLCKLLEEQASFSAK